MIIKSMARKDPTFWQLAQYIEHDASGDAFTHNLLQTGEDISAVANAFSQNHSYLPKRKGGNVLYHEIIALEPQPQLTAAQQVTVLSQMAARYCERRAPDQMAWGKVHLDTDYPHLHLMISANAKHSAKRHRLSRKQFAEIQRDVEGFSRANFPQLVGRSVYTKTHAVRRSPIKTTREGEMERRTKQPSAKAKVANQLRALFASTSQDSLHTDLAAAGFDLSRRGQHQIVTDVSTGRRYRLRTLGLEADFASASTRAPTKTNRANELLSQREVLDDLGPQIDAHLRDFDDYHQR